MARTRTIPIAPDSAIGALRGLGSGERLMGLYDYGVDGCAQRNREQVTAVLEELISLLDFGYGEIAEGFYRLYVFSLRQVREGQFDQPAWILHDLRDTWAQALTDAAASAALPLDDRVGESAADAIRPGASPPRAHRGGQDAERHSGHDTRDDLEKKEPGHRGLLPGS